METQRRTQIHEHQYLEKKLLMQQFCSEKDISFVLDEMIMKNSKRWGEGGEGVD